MYLLITTGDVNFRLLFVYSLQVCVDVQIPRSFGGVAGEALVIDTDSGFTPVRLKGEPV